MSTNKTQGIEMSGITTSSCHNRMQKYFNITQAELHKTVKRLHTAVNGRTKARDRPGEHSKTINITPVNKFENLRDTTVTATGDKETHKKRPHSTVIRLLEEPKPSTNKPATGTEVEELLRTKIIEEMESQRTPETEYTEI